MKYDIFISYRRKDSSGRSNVATARQFKMAFEGAPYNYKVFFDFSECTDNYFSDIILPAIRTCDYFVLVLTKDCLSRCFNEGDWVRREIEEALANNRKIVPITPDNECAAWPELPDSLNRLDGLQITPIHTDHMFEGCVDYLVKNRFHLDEGSEKTIKTSDGHEYVDLDLPSGTLWATCNVGANRPEDYGGYYSWDEAKATVANWSDEWSMPNKEQWEELINNTKSIWIVNDKVCGRLFTASNGQSLFLPAAGNCWSDEFFKVGKLGNCWSSTLLDFDHGDAWAFFFSSDECELYYNNRFCRLSVRPVMNNNI